MPIMGKNALDDASLFTGDRNGVTIHAPLIAEGAITVVPSADPSAGGVIYVEAGALKYRGSSGTVTTLGAA